VDEKHKEKPSLPMKSVAGALLFSVFLGPVGLLYASSLGGVIMISLGFIVTSLSLPVAMALVWVGSSIWSVIATNRYNKKVIAARWACR
jgi:hypothetical protein